MAELRPGDKVRVWGPLGNSFAMEPDTPTLLLAGGMGIVPFVGFVKEHPRPWNVSMLFGHREPAGCYPVDSINEYIELDMRHERTPGDLNSFVASVRERMSEYAGHNGLVLACGPLPFLRTVQKFAADLGVRTQLSLENRMGCGVALGKCAGGGHSRSPAQVAFQPPMSLPLRVQMACPSTCATQLVGGC